jgi:hypothetical protein
VPTTAGPVGPVRIHGLRELNRAFNRADKTLKAEWRSKQRALGEPVRAQAESRALAEIRNMPSSPQWGTMRVGVTTRVVYVAPRARGTKGAAARPNLARLLLDKAMIPALNANQASLLHRVEGMLDTMGRSWAAG